MANLLTEINNCEQCSLCKNMTVSPIAPQIFGKNPEILIIISGLVSSENDTSQSVLSLLDQKILEKIFKDLNKSFIITFQVKCITNKKYHTKKDIKSCNWVKKEIELFKPKHIILMGPDKYNDVTNISLYAESPKVIFASSIKTENFIKMLKAIL